MHFLLPFLLLGGEEGKCICASAFYSFLFMSFFVNVNLLSFWELVRKKEQNASNVTLLVIFVVINCFLSLISLSRLCFAVVIVKWLACICFWCEKILVGSTSPSDGPCATRIRISRSSNADTKQQLGNQKRKRTLLCLGEFLFFWLYALDLLGVQVMAFPLCFCSLFLLTIMS
nr:uncharacterized protein LOC104121376 [Nicotiana tomentosiformis]